MFREKIFQGLVLAFIIFVSTHAMCQEFPYSAPPAPEFDDLGNLMVPGRSEPTAPSQTRQSYSGQEGPTHRAPRDRSPRPYSPSDLPPRAYNAPTQPPPQEIPYRTPPRQPAPSPAAAPGRPPSQMPDRPDCSRYPVIIAQARSEPEMRAAAQQFFACLLKSGWQYEAAKEYIIKTIETCRLAR